MIPLRKMTLEELAAYICSHLLLNGIKCVLSGGACVSIYTENRYFKHNDTDFFIEFPTGPLSIGSEPVREFNKLVFETGKLYLLTPTDCVKDRLAAYYFWNDLQALEQAKWVSENQKINLDEVQRGHRLKTSWKNFFSSKTSWNSSQRIQNTLGHHQRNSYNKKICSLKMNTVKR